MSMKAVPVSQEEQKRCFSWMKDIVTCAAPSFSELKAKWKRTNFPRVLEYRNDGSVILDRTMRKVLASYDTSLCQFIARMDCVYLDLYFRIKMHEREGCVHRQCDCGVKVFGQREFLGFLFEGRLEDVLWAKKFVEKLHAMYEFRGGVRARFLPGVRLPSMVPDEVDWALGGKRGRTGWAGLDLQGWDTQPKHAKMAIFVDGVSQTSLFKGDARWSDVRGSDEVEGLKIMMPDGCDAHAVMTLRAVTD